MIRDATAADAPGIAAIWNPVIRETTITFNPVEKTDSDIAALIAERQAAGYAFLVAEVAGAVAGFASYAQFRGGLGYGRSMEHSIVLGEGARGKGIGRRLLTAIEDHARAGGAHSIYAGVSGDNPEGRAFHAAMGYAEIVRLSEVGWKFGRWVDLLLMQKFLS